MPFWHFATEAHKGPIRALCCIVGLRLQSRKCIASIGSNFALGLMRWVLRLVAILGVMIDEHRSMIDSPCSLDSPFTRGGALSHVCTLVRTRARTCVLRVYMGERERVCIYNYFSARYRERRKKFWPTNLLPFLKLLSLFSPRFSRLATPTPFPI